MVIVYPNFSKGMSDKCKDVPHLIFPRSLLHRRSELDMISSSPTPSKLFSIEMSKSLDSAPNLRRVQHNAARESHELKAALWHIEKVDMARPASDTESIIKISSDSTLCNALTIPCYGLYGKGFAYNARDYQKLTVQLVDTFDKTLRLVEQLLTPAQLTHFKSTQYYDLADFYFLNPVKLHHTFNPLLFAFHMYLYHLGQYESPVPLMYCIEVGNAYKTREIFSSGQKRFWYEVNGVKKMFMNRGDGSRTTGLFRNSRTKMGKDVVEIGSERYAPNVVDSKNAPILHPFHGENYAFTPDMSKAKFHTPFYVMNNFIDDVSADGGKTREFITRCIGLMTDAPINFENFECPPPRQIAQSRRANPFTGETLF